MTRTRLRRLLVSLTASAACVDAPPPALPRSPIATLTIVATDSTVIVGHSLQLHVIARDADGNTVSSASVVWTSAVADQLVINASGRVSAAASSPGGDAPVYATDLAGTAADTFVVRVVRHGWVKWRLPVGPMPLYGGPAQAPNGTLYVLGATSWSGQDATLYAVLQSGQIAWQRRLTQVDCCNYPMAGPDNTAYVVGQHVWAVSPDGEVRWSLTNRPLDPVPNIPTAHAGAIGGDGTLYAAMGCELLALRAATGDTVWIGPRASDCGWLIPPTVSADAMTAYFKNSADSLYAIDARTGTIRWATFDPDSCGGCQSYGVGPALTGSRLLVPTSQRILELDTLGDQVAVGEAWGRGVSEPAITSTGTFLVVRPNMPGVRAHRSPVSALWTAPYRGRWTWFGGPALAAGGTLYVAAIDAFYAFQISDTGASVRWRYPANPADSLVFVGAPLIGPDGTVYTFTSCEYGQGHLPCSDELIAFWEDRPVDPDSPWPMWRHDARRSGQAHK